MTALVWDQSGHRLYETGVDRGVLYLPSGGAVVWNGLISVTETHSETMNSYFIDGIKYLDNVVPAPYSAKLQAFTYPDELDSFTGNVEISPGVTFHDQRRIYLFGLSYRTLLANDLDGTDHGYRIHVVYNVMATESDGVFNTLSDSAAGNAFEWTLNASPNHMAAVRPTSHVSIDSRKLSSTDLTFIEVALYGTGSSDPTLPSLTDFAGGG